jgi:hemolysin activation/secretion protein
LGGFNSLRGFDELSIYASSYVISTAEFRFFTGTESFLNIFANGGWYEMSSQGGYFNETPLGLGTGINLKTQAGIFSVSLAIGWQNKITTQLQNSKIHIGYISTF